MELMYIPLLHEQAEKLFWHTESTFSSDTRQSMNVGRKKCFQYAKRMFPLFRAIVKFCSTNRLFT